MQSSVIRSYRYDPADKHLDLVFVSGREYRYHDVPEEIYREMREAASTGEYFNANVRDQFRFSEMGTFLVS